MVRPVDSSFVSCNFKNLWVVGCNWQSLFGWALVVYGVHDLAVFGKLHEQIHIRDFFVVIEAEYFDHVEVSCPFPDTDFLLHQVKVAHKLQPNHSLIVFQLFAVVDLDCKLLFPLYLFGLSGVFVGNVPNNLDGDVLDLAEAALAQLLLYYDVMIYLPVLRLLFVVFYFKVPESVDPSVIRIWINSDLLSLELLLLLFISCYARWGRLFELLEKQVIVQIVKEILHKK